MKRTCLYPVKILQCLGRLIMLPLNLLISLCEGLSFGQVQTRVLNIRCRLGKRTANRAHFLGSWFSRRQSSGRKLKLYHKTISQYCIADDSTAQDYMRENAAMYPHFRSRPYPFLLHRRDWSCILKVCSSWPHFSSPW